MIWAVVLAAGKATRFGQPKQYVQLGGRPMLDWSVRVARDACDGVVLVVPEAEDAAARSELAGVEVDHTVAGGATRSASVRAGLSMVPPEASVIVVHDAARPLATVGLFRSVIAAVNAGADGAVPVIAVVDTIKQVEGDRIVRTLERSKLAAVQTPQAFTAAALRRAHRSGLDATDDAALVEATGGRVAAVEGESWNLKVTVPFDLAVAELHLREHRGSPDR